MSTKNQTKMQLQTSNPTRKPSASNDSNLNPARCLVALDRGGDVALLEAQLQGVKNCCTDAAGGGAHCCLQEIAAGVVGLLHFQHHFRALLVAEQHVTICRDWKISDVRIASFLPLFGLFEANLQEERRNQR